MMNRSGPWKPKSLACRFLPISVACALFQFLVAVSFALPTTTTTTSTRCPQIRLTHHQGQHYQFVSYGTTLSIKNPKQSSAEEETLSTGRRKKLRSWEESFQWLVAYKEQYGNCNVPQKYNQDPRLGNWVASQRTRKSGLTLEQCAKLDGLGFTWANELCDEQWDEMFRWLERYATLNGGDCNVPTNDNGGNEKRLFLWLGKQRLRKSLLSEDQRTKLDKLGLIWEDANKEKQDYKWNELYDCLKEFREEHGNCRVPQRWDENPALGRWVARQRILYRQGLLPEDRQMQLDRLDFTWNVRKSKKKDYSKETEQWNRSYELLCSFHQEHGHCDVPTTRSYDLSLGNWVADQRKYHKNGILKEDRKKYLDQIGFKWSFENSREEQWLEKYNELKLFQQTNGHMRLPTNTRLATWALRQRVQYAAGKLEPERKEFLDELDFRWLEVSNSGSP